jgi:hypothetical protein
MTSDAFCTALPYAELEGPIPYDGPTTTAAVNDPDTSATVGSGYSPAEHHRHEVLRSVDRSVRRGRWGVCPECRWRKLARAELYRSPYNGAMDKHTRGECRLSTKRKAGTLQSMPMQRRVVQGLYKVCTERMYKGCCRGSTKYTTRTE